jgi:hypothetical protein
MRWTQNSRLRRRGISGQRVGGARRCARRCGRWRAYESEQLNAPQLHYLGELIEATVGKVTYAILALADRYAEERRAYAGACESLAVAPQVPLRRLRRVKHGKHHSQASRKGGRHKGT